MNKDKMLKAIEQFADVRVAVLGDLMLDVYLWGDVHRISPEAPVPVINVRKRTCCLGGAANVMRNVATLGGKVRAYGIMGDDSSGAEMMKEFSALGIDSEGILKSRNRRTTEKCRIIAGSQQLLRADFENVEPLSTEERTALVTKVKAAITSGQVDVVIFDDYAKGVLSSAMLAELIKAAETAGVITVLDPKPREGGVSPVENLTLLKPNRHEAFALAGVRETSPLPPAEDRALLTAATKIFQTWKPKLLLISLAAQGMALFRENTPPEIIPTRAREVFDVSGAGDTVAAVCALALAAKCPPLMAAQIANFAAGVVVGKIGTAPILLDELKEAVTNNSMK